MTGMSLRTVVFGLILSLVCVRAAHARTDFPGMLPASAERAASVAPAPPADTLPAAPADPFPAAVSADTLSAAAFPAPADSLGATAAARKRSFVRRIIDYFGESTQDRTFEKKIDFTFAGGPSYSKNTSLGIGILAAGLYRLDRTDSVTVPSDISLYANVSVSGFYSVGIEGNTIFAHNRQRVDYTLEFSSAPTYTWGIGYNDVQKDDKRSYTEQRYEIKARYLREILPHAYIGGLLSFDHAQASKYDGETPLFGDQRLRYTTTGLGLTVEYDSRDFIPNPFKGVYVSFQETCYPKSLGNCGKALWQTTITADAYHRVWKDAILATDLYAEFNSDGTPWPMLARMGGNQRMRGYYLGRFTDNDMITFQIELRQRIWRRIGAVVWGGAGNVFPSLAEFSDCAGNSRKE